jgi:DUF2075 family protein/DNA replication protein DnaC
MSHIKTFPFEKEKFNQIREYHFGKNWPVVYVIENGKEAYVGETTSAYSRSRQHFDNVDRKRLKNIHIITDEEYNKSAALDIEAWLIQYLVADGVFKLQNGNGGLQNHNYYDREKYKAKFEIIWENLKAMSLVKNDLVQLRNTDLFKYSPYKSLSEDQVVVVGELLKKIQSSAEGTYIVNGKPGTGKTILAVYLIKLLKELPETKHMNVGLVVPMTSLRSTLKNVFRNIKDLKPAMVIGPGDVVKQKYDLLIVDESHRLKRRVNIVNYNSFDQTNKLLGFGKEGTELDWIMKSSKHQLFFYDKDQSVKPTDVPHADFEKLKAEHFELISQQRISAGKDFIDFVNDLFELKTVAQYEFPAYDFKIYDDAQAMVKDIKAKDKEFGLCRVVAGYAWPWKTKGGKEDYDIEIGGLKLVWNSVAQDWVNSPNSINEVGCIHTVQGYDLNYVGVIVGPEISYDPVAKKLVIDPAKYKDINGGRGINDPEELKRYIINIYKTLLTRGIKGAYIYITDETLRNLIKGSLKRFTANLN